MTSGYFSLGQIAGGTLHHTPFNWGELQNIWSNDALAQKLASEFPTEGFNFRERNGGYFYRRTIVPLGSSGVDDPATLSDAWQALGKELVSGAFRSAMAAFSGTDLAGFPMEAVAFRGGQNTHYLPHVDASLRRGFRLIIYFQRPLGIRVGWTASYSRSAGSPPGLPYRRSRGGKCHRHHSRWAV